MADRPGKTKIFLTGGHEVIVEHEPSEVADAITRREPVHRFAGAKGREIYIVQGCIAGFERMPARSPAVHVT